MRETERIVREIDRLHFSVFHQTLSKFKLGKGQPPVLKFLSENDGCKQTEIAKMGHVSAATMTVTLQTMEKNGLIRRQSDEHDMRIMRVYLTKKGMEIQKKCDEAIDDISKEIYSVFTPEELICYKKLLEKKRERLKELLKMEEGI